MTPRVDEEGLRQRHAQSSANIDNTASRLPPVDDNDPPSKVEAIDPTSWTSPTFTMPLLVFIDMISVSLVVPLLFQYYKNAGVTSANQRELLRSVFSSSQIVGGLVLGALTDAKILKRKTILFLSFGGSAVAYAMIAMGDFYSLVASRVLVGLVKQTMTVTTSILTQSTTETDRAKYMGRLESSATAAWTVGPSLGALIYKYIDHRAPLLVASCLFLINMGLAAILVPNNIEEQVSNSASNKKNTSKGSFWKNLKSCFSSKALGSIIASMILFSWVTRATSYIEMGSYYEDMYGLETHHRGYIQSYQRILGFTVQSFLIGPILEAIGGERQAACLSAFLLAVASFLEQQQSMYLFFLGLAPIISLSTTMIGVSLRSLLTTIAPRDSMFSVFAALDVLQNASAVTVPFYRTFLFQLLGGSDDGTTTTANGMEGDPDPLSWVLSSAIHWLLATVALFVLLRPDQSQYFASPESKVKTIKRV